VRSIWVALSCVLGFAASAFATPFVPPPACVTDTLDSYLSLGSTGCSVDEIGFSGFSFSLVSIGGGAVPISPASITVTPSIAGVDRSLTFSSSDFSVVGSEFATYLIAYSIDPHPIIRGVSDQLSTQTPTFPGLASITTDLCLGATFTGPACGSPGVSASLNVFHNGTTAQLFDSVAFTPLALIGVRNTIDLQANGANADFDSFTNSAVFVPEPATSLLVISGLLGLCARRWRRRGQR
jgi:hypothetical protein